ncbi:hypothetical protein Bbelb_424090 [Branchiostoma belcheri]|nr:hypothetical protein Bbelb_424090 [Branchiostoma belcheri]
MPFPDGSWRMICPIQTPPDNDQTTYGTGHSGTHRSAVSDTTPPLLACLRVYTRPAFLSLKQQGVRQMFRTRRADLLSPTTSHPANKTLTSPPDRLSSQPVDIPGEVVTGDGRAPQPRRPLAGPVLYEPREPLDSSSAGDNASSELDIRILLFNAGKTRSSGGSPVTLARRLNVPLLPRPPQLTSFNTIRPAVLLGHSGPVVTCRRCPISSAPPPAPHFFP